MISKIKRGLVLILLTTFVWSSCGAAVEEEDYEDDVRPVATFVPTLKEVNEKLVQFSKLLKGKKVIQPAEEFACKLMSVKSSSCRLFISDDRQSLCLEVKI